MRTSLNYARSYALYFWVASYYLLAFVESFSELSSIQHAFSIAWRFAFWFALIIYALYNKEKFVPYGIKKPDKSFISKKIYLALYIAAPIFVIITLCTSYGSTEASEGICALTNVAASSVADTSASTVASTPLIQIFLESIYSICIDISAAGIEEILFRGIILFGVLKQLQVSDKHAIIFCALLFSAAHLINVINAADIYYTLLQVVFAFCASISLCALTLYTKSIVCAFVLRATLNISMSLIAAPATYNIMELVCLAALSLFYIAAGAYIVHKAEKKEEAIAQRSSILTLAQAVCFLLFLLGL